jgi:uncharacterized protein (DUF1015 family)
MDAGSVVIPPYVAGPLRLAPFRALMLAPNRIGDPASARAFARPYKDVAARLASWQERGQMWHDPQPALYLHEYTSAGITIRGLVGLVDVSRRATRPEERAILPHEGIYPAQADDLAARMEEMQLNPAPILLVHRAPDALRTLTRELTARSPDHGFTDRAKQQHRVWAIRDPAQLAHVDAALAQSRALIADGHHRYAAYLRLQQRAPQGPAGQGLVMLVDQDDTPLFLGAIHRVFSGTSLDDVFLAARTVGLPARELSETAAIAALAPRHLVVTDSERWASIELPADDDHAAVEVLHDQLVPAFPHGPRRTGYHHTVDDALAQVSPDLGVAVLMPAPDVGQVLRIAGDDRLLPEKATSFQPKPSLGVLIRSLRDG